MIVHVGGKRKHGRYLLVRQRVEFPGDKRDCYDVGLQTANPTEPSNEPSNLGMLTWIENQQNNTPLHDDNDKMDTNLIDLNAKPRRIHGQSSNNQEQGMEFLSGGNNESASVVPVGLFKRES
jgi:hypothetical protein